MADGKHTASVRPCAPEDTNEKVTSTSIPLVVTSLSDLEREAFKVGERPELAAQMAREMGLGAAPEARSKSVLAQVLRGRSVPPPEGSEWWPLPSPGAFDGGVSRVTGYVEFEDGVNLSLLMAPRKDMLGTMMNQVKDSYAFARYAALLVAALESRDESDTVEVELSRIGAVAFLAGWYMGHESADNRAAQRKAASKGSVEELVQLLSTQIHWATEEEWLLSRGYWTAEQVDEAKCIMRRRELPDATNPDGTYLEGKDA